MNAIITGATKGIGKAIACKLALSGYNLAICSRNQEEIEQVTKQLLQINPGITVIGLQADLSDRVQVQSFISFVQQHFSVMDVLINNAGTYIPASILDEDPGVLELQMNLNFNSAYHLCKAFGRQMRSRRQGHIINICSVAALNPVVKAGSYSVTKFALLGLTRVLREELMPDNVKVTAILPGSTLTASWAGEGLPSGRFVLPEDVANGVHNCLIASPGCNIDELVVRPVGGEV